MCWRKQAKISSTLPHLNCSPFLERGSKNTRRCAAISFWRSRTSPLEILKQSALSSPLSSGLSLGWIYTARPRYGKCPVACEAASPHLGLELPAGSGSSPVPSGWLQPAALKFCPSAISCCTQLVIHESVSCSCHHLSQQAFEATLGHPGERGKS